LATEIASRKKTNGPLAPLIVLVPTRLLGLRLQRTLARALANVTQTSAFKS